MIKKVVACLYIIHVVTTLHADSWSSIGDKFKDFGNGIGDTAKNVANGFKAMGGAVDSDYVYSFKVFNGIQSPITVDVDGAKKIMGARIDGSTEKSSIMPVGGDTGNTFSNMHLYFSIEIEGCNFSEDHYTLGQKNDTTVYAYHTYQDSTTAHCAEKVGIATTTNQFSGMIYNGTGGTVSIGFPWKGKTVSIPVAADTYSTLKSVDAQLVRPFTLNLNNHSIAVGTSGLGTEITTGEGDSAAKQVYPTRYNYEIISGGAVETGLTPGNYKQPTNGKIRDITPIDVYIWNQPPGEPDKNAGMCAFDMPSQPLWFAYTGQAIMASGSLVDKPLGMIPAGKCANIALVRPALSENLAKFYIVRLNTTDPVKAQQFIASLMNTKLPQYDITVSQDTLTQQQKNTLLLNKLPDAIGKITSNGVKGYIMGVDFFTPYGLASAAANYYTVPCPQYAVGAVMSTFVQFLTDISSSTQDMLWTNVQQWIKDYPNKPQDVREAVETFLIKNGPEKFVVKTQDASSLNAQGRSILSTVLYGPTSISRMSVWYQVASSTSGTPPKEWVDAADVIAL